MASGTRGPSGGRGSLTPDERAEAIRRLRARTATTEAVREGEVLSRHGEAADGVRIVEEGVVYFTRRGPDGPDLLLHVGLPGFFWGVAETCSNGWLMATTTATAATDGVISTIPSAAVDRLLADDGLVRAFVLSVLSGRSAAFVDMVATGLKSNPEARIAARLIAFARINTLPGPLPPRMDLPVSQATLSALVGMSRQTVNRALKNLAVAGSVDLMYRGVRVVDFARLARAAGEDRPIYRIDADP